MHIWFCLTNAVPVGVLLYVNGLISSLLARHGKVARLTGLHDLDRKKVSCLNLVVALLK